MTAAQVPTAPISVSRWGVIAMLALAGCETTPPPPPEAPPPWFVEMYNQCMAGNTEACGYIAQMEMQAAQADNARRIAAAQIMASRY